MAALQNGVDRVYYDEDDNHVTIVVGLTYVGQINKSVETKAADPYVVVDSKSSDEEG